MIKRHYFIAAKLKGSDVHASAVVTLVSFFRPGAPAIYASASRKLAALCDLQVDDFVPVAFNRV